MGKIQEFDIAFDKNKMVYSPGDSISGTVTVKVNQPLQCKGVKVNCNGFCGITNKVNDTAWTSEEQYFNSTVSVADKGTLKQGEHKFPFRFLIPVTAPTSFEGNYGRIIYRVRAFIDTPRFAKDYSTEKHFYLLRLLNLNEVPDIWGMCSSAVTQQFTYMLMKTGTVVLKAQTDMKGYTPDQIIQLTANIHNQSGKTTGNMAANLVQVSLKSPDVMLTLPIQIGNVSLDKKRHSTKKAAPSSTEDTSATVPTMDTAASPSTPTLPLRKAPKPAPRPAPRSRISTHSSPSAPPAEHHLEAEGGTLMNEDFSNKRQSQLVSPNAFSYAPGLLFSQNLQPNGAAAVPSGPAFTGSTVATAPYPPVTSPTSMPPLILPPDYGTSAFPQEAPPSYDESCNT
ncbi:arrestin domain-containing protein 1a isoform 2-T2 [Odontesthes bonariensis]|uniref:arrestin domain-containing protein 1a isoform X2 n=1 Tax=Odontesthes bonariensis TaxID=219752 RepID=UPI003F588861